MPTQEEIKSEIALLDSQIAEQEKLSPAGAELELQDIDKELASRGEVINDPIPLSQPQQFQHDEDVMSLASNEKYAEFTPDELNNDTQNLKEDAVIIPEEGSIEKQTYVDVLKDLKRYSKLFERFPVVGPLVKLENMKNIMTAVNTINSPLGSTRKEFVPTPPFGGTFNKIKITQKEKDDAQKLIEQWIIDFDAASNRTTGAKFTSALLEMPAFIIEFMLTGPVFKTGSAAAKKATTKLLGKYAEKATGKLAVRAAGAAFGSLIRTGVNVPKVIEGTVQRMTTGLTITDDGAAVFADAERNPWTALSKSFTDLYIENLSEIAGGAIGEGVGKAFKLGGKLAKKFPFVDKFTDELAEAWIKNAPKGTERTLQMFLTKANTKVGFNGILGEFSEERLGDVMRAATGLQEWEDVLLSKEDALIEAGIFTVFGGVNLASEKIFRKDAVKSEPVQSVEEIPQQELQKLESEPQKVNAATSAAALDGNAKTPPVVEPSGPVKRAIVRNIARAEDAVGTWGKTGKKVQKDLREIAFRTAVNVGNTTQNIKPLTKGLNKAEKETVAKLIDGAISTEGQPHRLVERAKQIKAELDAMQNEALKIGLRRTAFTGKAFPQVLTKEGQAFLEEAEFKGPTSSKVFAWAQNQVKDGKFKTVEDAIIGLQRYREGLISGKTGYIEGARTLEIGNEFRDWNLDKILSNTIESSWEKIEAGRQWGVLKDIKTDAGQILLPFKDIQIDMAKIRLDVGNNEANALNEYLKAQYGLSGADTAIVKVARVARTAQFVGKLAFSPLTITRNILDRYAKGMSHGTFFTNARATIKYPPFLNNWMKSARNIEEQMIRSGAVLGHGHLSEGFTGTEGLMSFIARPFGSSEKGNQTYIALVKKLQLESDVKQLMEMEGPDGVTSKMFDRLATIVGKSQNQTRNRVLTDLTNEQLAETFVQGKISDDVMSEVLHRTTTDSAFPLTLASKRLWWNQRPVLQAATQFKVWSADQTRFIYKDVLRYGVQTGDYSRLARFMVATWLAGELYNIARDELTGKDESVLSKLKGGTREEVIMAIGKDLVDGGIVGMIADFTYGIGDWAAGPTVNSLTGVATAIDQARGTATLPESLGQFLLKDAPALRQAQGLMDRLDRTFFDDQKNNLTGDYSRWQGRSFDFRKKQGESTGDIIGNRFMRSLRGTPQKKVTERSLSLNLIARQVLVGDYNDAAQHIKRVVNQTEIQDLDSTIQSFNQSMRNNSPFGNIADDKLGLFITQFDKDEAIKGLKLQSQWIKGYQQSLKTAFSELKAEGFEEDVKAKAEAYKEKMQPILDEASKRLKEITEGL